MADNKLKSKITYFLQKIHIPKWKNNRPSTFHHFTPVNGTSLNIFDSYLTNRKDYAECENSQSDQSNYTTGVP